MNKPTIFLDMDELLADFIGGACRAHGVERAAMEAKREPGVWDMTPALSRVVKRQLSLADFWRPINALQYFWETLAELPTLSPLVALAEEYAGENWYIVSSPGMYVANRHGELYPNCPRSYAGKVIWLQRRFGADFVRFHLATDKSLLASRGRILVDDRAENCEKFIAAGGQAILFPHRGNELHGYADDPMPVVRNQLEQILSCK